MAPAMVGREKQFRAACESRVPNRHHAGSEVALTLPLKVLHKPVLAVAQLNLTLLASALADGVRHGAIAPQCGAEVQPLGIVARRNGRLDLIYLTDSSRSRRYSRLSEDQPQGAK
jgi:hypothetical protein